MHTRLMLFLSAYSPLFFLLAILYFEQSVVISAFLVGLGLLSLFFLFVGFFLEVKRGSTISGRITGYKNRDGESLNFMVSYIIPLASFQANHSLIVNDQHCSLMKFYSQNADFNCSFRIAEQSSFDIYNVVALLFVFFLLAWLSLKLNMLHINPVLLLFNYHIYDVKIELEPGSFLLISSSEIMDGQTLYLIKLREKVLIHASQKGDEQ